MVIIAVVGVKNLAAQKTWYGSLWEFRQSQFQKIGRANQLDHLSCVVEFLLSFFFLVNHAGLDRMCWCSIVSIWRNKTSGTFLITTMVVVIVVILH